MATTYERFWALVDRSAGPAGCWFWTGPVTATGAGAFTVRGRRTTARRYAYLMQYGDPGPLRVVRAAHCPTELLCVNWGHLTVSTARTVALGNGSAAAANAARRCGHPPGEVYIHPRDGRRECALCKAARRCPKRARAGTSCQ